MSRDHLYRKNMLWEASRMFLPEHREAILKQRKESTRFIQPELDEQKLEEMTYMIEEAMVNEQPIEVTYAGEYESLGFCGFIDKVDTQSKTIHLSNGKHKKKIAFSRLISIDWA